MSVNHAPHRLFAAFLAMGGLSVLHARSTEEMLRGFGSGFGKISPLALVLCGATVVLLLGGLTIWEVLKADSKQREIIQIGWNYFAEMASQKKLTQLETDLLRKIVECGEVSSADMIFDSSFIYEDSLESFLLANSAKLEKDGTLYASLRVLRNRLGYARLPPEIPICSTRQLEDGLRVSLFRGGSDKPVKASIVEVNERHWIVMLERAAEPAFAAGETVSLSLLRGGDGEYKMKLKVLGMRESANTLTLEHTREVERKQLRNWVRIAVNIPCRITVIKKPEGAEFHEASPKEGKVLEGRLLDLSGGGACARFSESLQTGYRLSLNFDLPGTSLRGVQAEVMRLVQSRKQGMDIFEHNLKFMDVETAYQEKIVRYVFEKQRIDSQMKGQANA